MGELSYRLVIVDPATQVASPFTPGDTSVAAGHWWVTSIRGGQQAYIESPPTGDGQEVDLLTGRTTDGAYTVRVLDLPASLGAGVDVNDELNDTAWYTRWTGGYNPQGVGFFGLGSPSDDLTVTGVTFGGTVPPAGALIEIIALAASDLVQINGGHAKTCFSAKEALAFARSISEYVDGDAQYDERVVWMLWSLVRNTSMVASGLFLAGYWLLV